MSSAPNRLVVLLIVALGLTGLATAALGHALQPGYLELRLVGKDFYAVTWRTPAVGGRALAIAAELPENCEPRRSGQTAWDGAAFVVRWSAKCSGGLEGGAIHIDGLEKTSTDVLVRFDFADRVNQAYRLTASEPSFVVPTQPSSLEVVRTYLLLGIEHILFGIDHLLFVLALLLLVKNVRRLIATITAFTLAHSLTLAGATLGFIHLPGPPVEVAIALSIVFVAAEIIHSRRGNPGLTERYPWVVAFTFGLLHGFGFAGALAEIGLPQKAIPIALLFFNVGVEVGQLLFIAAVLAVTGLGQRVHAAPGPAATGLGLGPSRLRHRQHGGFLGHSTHRRLLIHPTTGLVDIQLSGGCWVRVVVGIQICSRTSSPDDCLWSIAAGLNSSHNGNSQGYCGHLLRMFALPRISSALSPCQSFELRPYGFDIFPTFSPNDFFD